MSPHDPRDPRYPFPPSQPGPPLPPAGTVQPQVHVQVQVSAQAQAMGRLEVHTSFFPLAFILLLCTPVITINGYPQPRPWGTHYFELVAGQYQLNVHFPYMFIDRAGPATVFVPIYAGHVTRVTYEAPFFMFSGGTMRVVATTPMPAAFPMR